MAKKDKKNKKGKKKAITMKGRMLLVLIILLGMAFLPTSMLLFVGMLPSLASMFLNPMGVGARPATVSAMNLAGVIPFILKLWSTENDFQTSFEMVTDPQVIVIIYTAAAFGYLIDWLVSNLVASFLYQKGINRMKQIKKRQEYLVSQWGEGVAEAAKIQKEMEENEALHQE